MSSNVSAYKTITTIIVTSVAICCIYYSFKGCSKSTSTYNQRTIKENYDPQDMGGRNYWGFGREYGYPQRDMDITQPICYQISSRHLCREGYSRKINTITMSDECCVNNFVYQ
jgi:hypothetical protein